ncbi:hypothetical protein LSPH24S_04627 [Lysinibacillus sphaericus]
MEHLIHLSNPIILRKSLEAVIQLAEQYKKEKGRIPVLMEVCGSHTMAFAKTGIKTRLKDHVRLIARTRMSSLCNRSKIHRYHDRIITRYQSHSLYIW